MTRCRCYTLVIELCACTVLGSIYLNVNYCYLLYYIPGSEVINSREQGEGQ